MRVTIFLFFNESCFGGVAVEANGKVGDLFNNLIIADFLLQVLEFTLLEWNELNLIQNFILKDPQVLTPIISTIQHIQIHLGNHQTIFPDTFDLLFNYSGSFFLQKSQLKVLS